MLPEWLLDVARRNESLRRFAKRYRLYNRVDVLLGLWANIPRRLFKYSVGYNTNYYFKYEPKRGGGYLDGVVHEAMLCGALYAVGYNKYEDLVPILDRIKGRHYTVQARIIKQMIKQTPRHVIDLGGGRGELAALLQECGIRVTVIDPSKGAANVIQETSKWFGKKIDHIRCSASDMWYEIQDKPDCIIMSESIEHISFTEFDDMLKGISNPCKLVIVNEIDFWPIQKHGWPAWNHIRTIDDNVYDDIAQRATRTISRKKSHLILEW